MAELFDLDNLSGRLIGRSETLEPEAVFLLEETLICGEFERGAAPRITGLPERTARRVLGDVVETACLPRKHLKDRSRSASLPTHWKHCLRNYTRKSERRGCARERPQFAYTGHFVSKVVI